MRSCVNDCEEGQTLDGTILKGSDSIECEADPWHFERFIEERGLAGAKAVPLRTSQRTFSELEADSEFSHTLDTRFCDAEALGNHLAADCIDT